MQIEQMSMRRRAAISLLIFAIGFTAGLLVASSRSALAPTVNQQAQRASASLMIDFENGTVKTFTDISLQPNESLFALTKRIADENKIPFESKEYSGLGMFISKMGTATPPAGAYWQYWVNNRYAQVGADQYMVRSGDSIEWKLLSGQQ